MVSSNDTMNPRLYTTTILLIYTDDMDDITVKFAAFWGLSTEVTSLTRVSTTFQTQRHLIGFDIPQHHFCFDFLFCFETSLLVVDTQYTKMTDFLPAFFLEPRSLLELPADLWAHAPILFG